MQVDKFTYTVKSEAKCKVILKIKKQGEIMYNYHNSKANIINILKSKTPIEKKTCIPHDNEFTYENGIRCWVGAIFVDIENSTKLFYNKDEKLARLMRAFTSEIITIFQNKDNYNQIGIRGDCVYAIYNASYKSDLKEIFEIAYLVNTFMKMFNKIIVDYGYQTIKVGIGLGCDENLIIKAGRTGTGINDKIWIGKAVVDASNLSSKANRNDILPIALSSTFYNNIKELLEKRNPNYKSWIKKYYYDDFYHCDIIENDFASWINRGMKDNV